jgi:uracil-DNA glycosylase
MIPKIMLLIDFCIKFRIMNKLLDASWKNQLKDELLKPYFKSLEEFLTDEYDRFPEATFPNKMEIFRAFSSCPFDDVKVVVLGQDPYPTKGHAHGLSFSVDAAVRPLPRSLRNIYKEMETDLGIIPRDHGDLSHWGEQGVLLLNAILTVREGIPESHANVGWETFTDAVISKLNASKSELVFVLWGNKAQQKAASVDRSRHMVLTSAHPSPLSAYRGFFGSRPFSKINDYLNSKNRKPIRW